jgi:hypothetical protein
LQVRSITDGAIVAYATALKRAGLASRSRLEYSKYNTDE